MQGSYVHRNKAYAKLETALSAEPLGKIKDENGNFNVEPVIGSTMINLLLNTQSGVYKNQDQNFKTLHEPLYRTYSDKRFICYFPFGSYLKLFSK